MLTALACGDGGGGDPLQEIRERQEVGDYQSTIEPLREILAERPDDPEVNFLYGLALSVTDQKTLASWSLRKAMEHPEWTVRAGNQLAYTALETRDFNEVVNVATRVLEIEPENTSALLLRARAQAHWRQDPEAALADAERVLELDPDAIGAMEPRIMALLLLQRTEEAREALKTLGERIDEAGASEGTIAWHCATRAIFAEESGEAEREALTTMWDACLEAHPAAPEVVWAAVGIFDGWNLPDRSLAVLRAAFAAAPEVTPYRVALADRLGRMGEGAEGEAILLEATQASDAAQAADAWFNLGQYRKGLGDQAGAAAAFERAVEGLREVGSVPPQLWLDLADTLVVSGQLERAEEVLAELELPAHRHLIRARIAQERGDPVRALAEFDRTFQLWPDNPWARWFAARAAEKVGNFDRALDEYQTAIRIDKNATDARTRAARQLLAEGKAGHARQLLRIDPERSLDAAGHLLNLRIAGASGNAEFMEQAFTQLAARHPHESAAGVAATSAGYAEREGPAAGAFLLRTAQGEVVDWRDPEDAAALEELVRLDHAAGEPGPAPELKLALQARPGAAVFQAIAGLDRELAGEPEAARAAYQRALEIDDAQPLALTGLGRLALDDDPSGAADLFARAAEADPSDPGPALLEARARIAAGESAVAAQRLDDLLDEHPLHAEAAMLRVELDLQAGTASPRTLELARRAVRFGGGVASLELLAQVHEKRGEETEAARAQERIRTLRERAADQEDPDAPGEEQAAAEAG